MTRSDAARRISNSGATNLDFQVLGNRAYSLAEQFELLAVAVSQLIEGRTLTFPIRPRVRFGPEAPPPSARAEPHLNWPAFRDAALDAQDYIQRYQGIPARVFVGADPVPPADFMAGLAAAYLAYHRQGRLPLEEGVLLGRNLAPAAERYIAQDSPGLFGGWIIHKEGFRAPKIMELARGQAWTLKPAIRQP